MNDGRDDHRPAPKPLVTDPSLPSCPAPARPPGSGRSRAERAQLRFLFLVATIVGATVIGFTTTEVGLRLASLGRPPQQQLKIPDEWALRPVTVPGAVRAEYWHGHLHVRNADGMRTLGKYPPKPAGVFRILAVGDSLTYGAGVAAEEAWPAVLGRLLGPGFEVLNLGVCGAQSEPIAELVRQQFEPAECVYSTLSHAERLIAKGPRSPAKMCQRYRLDPDLIVYGMCLNDLLPNDTPPPQPYTVYLPGGDWLLGHTLTAPLVADRYNRLLVRLGLRADFVGEIEAGGGVYRERFGADMRAMSRTVARHGLPPIISMVLTQYPGRSTLLTAAEEEMRRARLRVIPCRYCDANAGADWSVSRWEPHPNAHAHEVFAAEFAEAIRAEGFTPGSPRPSRDE